MCYISCVQIVQIHKEITDANIRLFQLDFLVPILRDQINFSYHEGEQKIPLFHYTSYYS